MLNNAPIVPYIPATDVKRARAFYENKVGLKPKQEIAGGVVYECGQKSWIFMYPTSNAGTNKASTAFWSVDDVEAEVAELKARGVVFEEYRPARDQNRQRHRDQRGHEGSLVQGHRGQHHGHH